MAELPTASRQSLPFDRLLTIQTFFAKQKQKLQKTVQAELFGLLEALCDPNDIKDIQRIIDEKHMPNQTDVLTLIKAPYASKSAIPHARECLQTKYSQSLSDLLTTYKVDLTSRPSLPRSQRTLATFKQTLSSVAEEADESYLIIHLWDHIDRKYRIGDDTIKLFVRGEKDFGLCAKEIRWNKEKMPIDVQTMIKEISLSMRIIKDHIQWYTIAFFLDNSTENDRWLHYKVFKQDVLFFQNTLFPSYGELKKYVDGLIGKKESYTAMIKPRENEKDTAESQKSDDDDEDDEEDD